MPAVQGLLTRLAGKEPAAGVNPDECVALGAGLAGVFRHRPSHPALQMKRRAMADRARELEEEERREKVTDAQTDVPIPERQAAPRGAAVGLAYGGHVAEQALRNAQLSKPPLEDEEPPVRGPQDSYLSYEEGVEPPQIEGGRDRGRDVSPIEQARDRRPDGGLWELPAVEIRDCTTHPLGIIVLDKERKERVVELVPEATPLPHEYKGRFAYAYENMTAVRVEVTEGVGGFRDEVSVIGKVELTGLPPRPRGTPIEVIYQYGIDQILSVRVIDVETGKSRETTFRLQGGMTAEQVENAKERNAAMAVD
jgi:molecular chaperone DnaK (HSP70)